MINLKRVQDLEHLGSLTDNSTNNYIEITRYNAVGSYNSLRISMANFLRFFEEKLSTVRADDKISYVDTNVRLGTVIFSSLKMSDENYVIADGSMYTDNKKNQYKGVFYIANLTEFIDILGKSAERGSNSVISDSISNFQNYRGSTEYRGKYICDFDKRIISVPNLNGCMIRSSEDTGIVGQSHEASLPGINGYFKACYHGFAQSQKKQQRIIDNMAELTNGVFSVESGEIDKNYINTEIDLSDQSEKYGWLTDIGQVVGFDASRCSKTYSDEKEDGVDVDSTRYIPYILISNKFTLIRKT